MNSLQFFQSTSLLNGIISPLVLVNGEGKPVETNLEGERLFQKLTLSYTPFTKDLSVEQKLQALIQSCCPVSLYEEGRLLKITPLEEMMPQGDLPKNRRPSSGALLEWLPLPGNEPLRMMQEVGQAVNSSLILEDIFDALGEVLRRYIPYEEATILILDDTQNGIKILVKLSQEGSLDIMGENNSFAGYDAVVDALLKDPKPRCYEQSPLPQTLLFPQAMASAIAVPLFNKGIVVGLISMATSQEAGFQVYEQELLSQVSEQLAVAVENAKLYWQTQAQAGREFLINQITKSIRQSLEIETILNTAVQELGRVMGVSRCLIQYFEGALASEETARQAVPTVFSYLMPGTQAISASEGATESSVFQGRKQGKESLKTAEQSLNPFILNDVRDCPATLIASDYFQQHAIKSLAIFPILIRNTLVGTITLHQCDVYRSWLMEDIELLIAIAEHLGVALQQAKLFQELEGQKQELESTLEELQQAQIHLVQSEKMAVLGQFVAGIAHEVNTPLGTMSSNNATLASCVERIKSNSLSPEKLASLLESMQELLSLNKLGAERIHEIVKSLRNFARLDESELKTVDIHEGINSTLLVMRSSLPSHLRIIKKYGAEVPWVQCYPGLLNQVFMNILVNATHAMAELPEGAITIETRLLPEEEQVEILFSDTGKGIAPDHLSKIFDPGFTTKGRGVGTGLGLALCYKIVEKHQGAILVESHVGSGTCFTVKVPIHQAKYVKNAEMEDDSSLP